MHATPPNKIWRACCTNARHLQLISQNLDRTVPSKGVFTVAWLAKAVTRGPHKTERALTFTADGYCGTGDMCLQLGTRVLFVGRKGDMIKTASSNVSPSEGEMELQDIDGAMQLMWSVCPIRNGANWWLPP